LRACGIGERALVGLHLERSIPFVVAMLGILKANCGVVPLPPSYPESRRREILAYAQLDAVIESESSRMPSGTAARVLDVAELEQYSAAAGMTAQATPVRPLSSSARRGRRASPR
jgi:non-ribosomal peptide synthetase component F